MGLEGDAMTGADLIDHWPEFEQNYAKAVELVRRDKKASGSYVQRSLQIGYNQAFSIIDRMEAEGVVSPANHLGKREVL
jgi:S-DNA-T family DNA segregation ATPase FtsK/SpoIIIE